MSEIYQNAVDSLRIGIEFFLKERSYSSRKHAILTLFHSIELFLKEYLHQTNPILIYKNIDMKINEDSLTVGIKEITTRLENLGLGLPKNQQSIIEKIQKRRNRIEHYRYDHRDEDEVIIAESLKFILFFVDDVLKRKLDTDIDPDLLREIQRIVFERNQLYWLAKNRFERWINEALPDEDDQEIYYSDEFSGTFDCPICRQPFLVAGYFDKPFCFYCNTTVEAGACKNCGMVYLTSEGCVCCQVLTSL